MNVHMGCRQSVLATSKYSRATVGALLLLNEEDSLPRTYEAFRLALPAWSKTLRKIQIIVQHWIVPELSEPANIVSPRKVRLWILTAKSAQSTHPERAGTEFSTMVTISGTCGSNK